MNALHVGVDQYRIKERQKWQNDKHDEKVQEGASLKNSRKHQDKIFKRENIKERNVYASPNENVQDGACGNYIFVKVC